MYIFKNAIKCIGRSKGRNILIGIIVLVISVSACIGLSILQASDSAKKDALDGMSVTATISFDRQSMMNGMRDRGDSDRKTFDKNEFAQIMGDSQALTLDEYKVYSQAESVNDFYYVSTAYVNGSGTFMPVSTDVSSSADEETNYMDNEMMENMPGFGGGRGGKMNGIGMTQSDFTVLGFSSDSAMTDFQSGIAYISQGSVFEEGSEALECIISDELALYNSLEVGDTVSITNPNNAEESYVLTVVGLFTDSSSNENSFLPMGFSNSDPANKIYMSYAALESIVNSSKDVSVTVTDEDTGNSYESNLTHTIEATYVFADTDAYYRFEDEVRELGLDDSYIVNSSDVDAFENSLVPLETLSTMAIWFLLIILIIGAIILIVLNIFSVRERKYEIGVLTAIGMKKSKVAIQFLTEIFIVTIIAVIVGIIIGGVSSVPVTNALLKNQASSQNTEKVEMEMNFGRPGNFNGMPDMENMPEDVPQGGGRDMLANVGKAMENYITEINSAMNLVVVMQMLGIAVILTLFAGAASVLFIMRYEPLKILANRD